MNKKFINICQHKSEKKSSLIVKFVNLSLQREKQRYTSIYKIPHWVYNKLGVVKKENLEIIYELVELFKK